ncbi:hypothetical protein DP107_17895 [Haloglomus irregulare]|uniref:Uncharacterized protein n=1 Tax=Haloglomus irregulare TaxID=2234134 RepID=A0A554MUP8_9EURY|nr:hypothetical protein DP107_17895 [Haloglomus irregulare]
MASASSAAVVYSRCWSALTTAHCRSVASHSTPGTLEVDVLLGERAQANEHDRAVVGILGVSGVAAGGLHKGGLPNGREELLGGVGVGPVEPARW